MLIKIFPKENVKNGYKNSVWGYKTSMYNKNMIISTFKLFQQM